jgi:hypothetical protein
MTGVPSMSLAGTNGGVSIGMGGGHATNSMSHITYNILSHHALTFSCTFQHKPSPITWECAELLIELGGGSPGSGSTAGAMSPPSP